MPRNYNSNTITGGASGSGRAYTPQVTPWQRNDDDVSTLRGARSSRDYYDSNSFGRDDYDGHEHSNAQFSDRNRGYSRDRDNQAYYGNDLVPTYGQAGFGANDRDGRGHEYRNDHQDGRHTDYRDREREDEHRAGHRKHWENREPDYRYQYNDYDRVKDHDVRRENLSRDRSEFNDRYASDGRRPDSRNRDSQNREDWGYTEGPRYNTERYARDYDQDRYNDRDREYSRDRMDQGDPRGNWNRR